MYRNFEEGLRCDRCCGRTRSHWALIKKLKNLVICIVLGLVLGLNGSVSHQGSSFSAPDWALVENGVKICQFFTHELRVVIACQLLPVLRRCRKGCRCLRKSQHQSSSQINLSSSLEQSSQWTNRAKFFNLISFLPENANSISQCLQPNLSLVMVSAAIALMQGTLN